MFTFSESCGALNWSFKDCLTAMYINISALVMQSRSNTTQQLRLSRVTRWWFIQQTDEEKGQIFLFPYCRVIVDADICEHFHTLFYFYNLSSKIGFTVQLTFRISQGLSQQNLLKPFTRVTCIAFGTEMVKSRCSSVSLIFGSSPLVEHPSEVIVSSVVGHGFGIQRPVDGWLPSLHGQTIQLHCGCYTACVRECSQKRIEMKYGRLNARQGKCKIMKQLSKY